MTFARAKATPGWAFADTLTSAQLNAIDIDHANALDKSVAGDQLAGVVTMTSLGLLDGNSSGVKIRVSANGAKIAATANGASIEANASGAFIGATATGALVAVSGGAVFQTVTDIFGDVTKAIRSYTFATAQSRTVHYNTAHVLTSELPTGAWTITYDLGAQNAPQLTGQATSTAMFFPFRPHDGSLIQSLTMYVKTNNAHVAIPARLPYASIVRVRYTPIALQPWWLWWTADDLGTPTVLIPNTPPSNFPTPLTLASYNSASIQPWTNTMLGSGTVPAVADPDPTQPVGADQRRVDTSKYLYFVKVFDEGGNGSLVGNTYPGFDVTYSGITDLRFGN